MSRLIDADKVAEAIAWLDEYDFVIWHDVQECIDKVPTVDIDAITASHEQIGFDKGFRDGYAQATSEVRLGRWINCSEIFSDGDFECSVCQKRVWDNTDYCPNCGAKMDEVEE